MTIKGPNFLGIGMERAGTSWLFTQIAAHPDIWVPPLKELHFFDVIDPRARLYKHRYRYHLPSRMKQKFAPLLKSKLAHRPEFFKNSCLDYLRWDWRFFTGAFDVEWYKGLFDERFTGGKVCGEITPAYSNLTSATIRTILDMNPEMKFILIVRNPVDRMWSGVVHHFRHIAKRDFDGVSEDEMLAFLDHSAAENRSNVASILESWQAEVPQENLLIQPFERIALDPEGLLGEVYRHIGARDDFLPPESLYKARVNAYTRRSFVMPEAVKVRIEDLCRDSLEAMKKVS